MAKKSLKRKNKRPRTVCSTAGSKLAKHGYSTSGAMLGSSKCKS